MSDIEKKNPVNAKKFTYQILISKGKGKLTRLAEKMIVDLATNAIKKKIYYLQEDKEDALQSSLYTMLTNYLSFNPDKTENAFAYFTEIHKRAIAESINIFYMKKGLKKEAMEEFEGILKVFPGDAGVLKEMESLR